MVIHDYENNQSYSSILSIYKKSKIIKKKQLDWTECKKQTNKQKIVQQIKDS